MHKSGRDSNFKEETFSSQFSVQTFKLKYSQFRFIGALKRQGIRHTPVDRVKATKLAIGQPFLTDFTRDRDTWNKRFYSDYHNSLTLSNIGELSRS